MPSPTPSSTTTLVGTPHLSYPHSPTIQDKKPVALETCKIKQVAVEHLSLLSPLPVSRTQELTTAFKTDVWDPLPELRKITIADLRLSCVLGSGGQGVVYLVQDRTTHKLFALKAIMKQSGRSHRHLNIFGEQDLLKRMAGNPRFLSMQASFEDSYYFYLLTVSPRASYTVSCA